MTTATTCHPSTTERPGAATFKGSPLTVLGPEITVGSKAPEFEITGQDLTALTLGKWKGKTLLLNVVPSLDTPVCDAQTRRFNEEAGKLPGVNVLTVSMDLPFAQKRWCASAGLSHVVTGSDHRCASFGKAYGTLIKELRLLSRAVFLVDSSGVVRYVEYVREVTEHPKYDAALAAVRSLK